MGLPDSSQLKTIVTVGVMMGIRYLEAHVKENSRHEAPTKEQLQELDCLKDLNLFETMCKILNIPMEVKNIWARRRLMPWFRANMTAWLYEHARKHMSKHSRMCSAYQLIRTAHSAVLRHMLPSMLIQPCSHVGSKPWHQSSSGPYVFHFHRNVQDFAHCFKKIRAEVHIDGK